jgi:MFS family permease
VARLSVLGVLALKLALAPGLVGTATRVARRLGHRAGGLVGGLPVVAAPIVLIYAIEHGQAFAEQASRATVLGIVSLVGFCTAYALAAERAGVAGALLAGWAAFGAGTLLFDTVELPLGVAAVLAALAVAAAAAWLHHREPAPPRPRGNDLMVWRLLATAAMVLALTTASGALDPWLSGLLAPFPIITAVLAAFTHAQAGPHAAVELLAGLVPGLASFVLFFVLLALLLNPLGIAAAFALASAAALASHALLVLREQR